MATGAHGNPGADAAGAVEVVAQGAHLGGATALRQDQEAGSAGGRQPRETTAMLDDVQVGMYEHIKIIIDNFC